MLAKFNQLFQLASISLINQPYGIQHLAPIVLLRGAVVEPGEARPLLYRIKHQRQHASPAANLLHARRRRHRLTTPPPRLQTVALKQATTSSLTYASLSPGDT